LQEDCEKENRPAKWSAIFHSKDQGGPGIHDTEVKNRALLGKWLYKLNYQRSGLENPPKTKIVGSLAMSHVYWKPRDLHFWAGLMATEKIFFPYGSICIKGGSEIRFWEVSESGMLLSEKNIILPIWVVCIKDSLEIQFWEDKWHGDATLRDQYLALYNIIRHKSDTVAKVLESYPPNVMLGMDLNGPKLASWNTLLHRLQGFN
jgi:hypothetical protein